MGPVRNHVLFFPTSQLPHLRQKIPKRPPQQMFRTEIEQGWFSNFNYKWAMYEYDGPTHVCLVAWASSVRSEHPIRQRSRPACFSFPADIKLYIKGFRYNDYMVLGISMLPFCKWRVLSLWWCVGVYIYIYKALLNII